MIIRRFRRIPAPGTQDGAALVVVLIFLCVLMLIGASASLNSNLQERMAGNLRNRDLAFEAAEAALNDAVITFASWRTLAFDGTSSGLFTYNSMQANDANYWRDTSHWTSYRTPTVALNQVAEQPRYLVEKMPLVGTTEYYRVTARGVGGTTNAVVVLQAIYNYTPPPTP